MISSTTQGLPLIYGCYQNKRSERRGYIQLIDTVNIYHKLRKALGNKNEISSDDRKKITELYSDFKENELVKIYKNTEFVYREYTVMQPLQKLLNNC